MTRGEAISPQMRKIWAPWRKKFITHGKPKGCIFCQKPRSKNDAKNYLLKRSRTVFTMLNLYPYNNGHLLISPYRHVTDFAGLRDDEAHEMMEEIRFATQLLRKKLKAKGFNIGANIGVGGASFNHLHFHIVPRWHGDTNFMPVIAGEKVISDSLDGLYALLKPLMGTWKTK